MNITRAASLLAVASVLALAAACGSSAGTASEQAIAVDGLTVVEMDEAAGKMVLSYAKDGRTIRYELLLGAKMETPPSADELAANPELPTYMVDAQVMDATGQPFHQQMGADSFIDPTWKMPKVAGFIEADRVKDISLMRDAVAAFRKLRVPASLEQLRLTGVQIGLSVDQLYEKPAAGAAGPTTEAGGEGTIAPKATIAWGPTTVYKWDYRIRNKSIFGGAGDHTAVHLRGWSSGGSIVYNATSCNHGSCANYSDMSTHCVMSGYRYDDGTNSRYFYSDTTTSTGSRNGGCTTHYDWDSTSVLGGAHNCNDDSQLQRDAIYYDSARDTDGGVCNSLSFHNSSPGCH